MKEETDIGQNEEGCDVVPVQSLSPKRRAATSQMKTENSAKIPNLDPYQRVGVRIGHVDNCIVPSGKERFDSLYRINHSY